MDDGWEGRNASPLLHLSCMTTSLSCLIYARIDHVNVNLNAAGRERNQLGTRMSADLDWSLGRMPLLFPTCGEKACLMAEVSNAVSELVVSGYKITPKMTRKLYCLLKYNNHYEI